MNNELILSEKETPSNKEENIWMSSLMELRRRLIYVILFFICCSIFCYFYIEQIMAYLMTPVGQLYYLQPAEAFLTYLEISLCGGFILSLPFLLYEVGKLFFSAMTPRERRCFLWGVPAALGLFATGVCFAFFCVLPVVLKFFLDVGNNGLQPLFSVSAYIDFLFFLILPFGFVFEIPLLLVCFAALGLIDSCWLRKKRRLMIFGSFIIGAVLSPGTDVFSQITLAVPIIVLYESGICLVRYVLKK